jgi:hypothetical protein
MLAQEYISMDAVAQPEAVTNAVTPGSEDHAA